MAVVKATTKVSGEASNLTTHHTDTLTDSHNNWQTPLFIPSDPCKII